MAKKKSQKKQAYVYSETPAEDTDFAAALLSSMSAENETQKESENEPEPDKRKRNRRKEKLAQRELERAQIFAEASAEGNEAGDRRDRELEDMHRRVTGLGLEEHEVPPDGHCLFHALSDQLALRKIQADYRRVRSDIAEYIRQHGDEFTPYLIDEETGECQDIAKYTDTLENTPVWGGMLEIVAAAGLYGIPIKVVMAHRDPMDIGGEGDPMYLAYYLQMFGLGAHYNSLRPVN